MSLVPFLVSVLFLIGFFVGFVFSLVWIYGDAVRRGKSGVLVALLAALIAWPLSLLVWIALRPNHGLEQYRRGKRLSRRG